jgi:hypothetical protein
MRALCFIFPMLCLVFFSCERPPLLRTDFPSETVGAPPRLDIPGPPEGDSIIIGSLIEDQVLITTFPSDTLKALRLPGGRSGHRNFVAFRGVRSNLREPVFFVVHGRLRGGDLTIDLSDGFGNPFARAVVAGSANQVKIVRSFEDFQEEVVGEFNQNHQRVLLIFSVNPRDLTYNISVYSHPGPVRPVAVNGIPTITRDALSFANPARPQARLTLSSGEFLIESVQILRRRPRM